MLLYKDDTHVAVFVDIGKFIIMLQFAMQISNHSLIHSILVLLHIKSLKIKLFRFYMTFLSTHLSV